MTTVLHRPPTAPEPLARRASAANPRRARGGRRRGPGVGVVLALAFLVFLGVAAAWPSLLQTHDPLEITPDLLAPPSAEHWLGTDENGRDTYSRIVGGAREAVLLGFGAVTLSLVGGSLLGVLAGLGNRLVETVVMRFVDIGLAFPEMLLALVVIAVSGRGARNALIAIGIAGIPTFARLVRAQTLTIRRSSYVESARGLGLTERAVVLRHVLPNAVRPVLVLATIGVGTASVAGAGLSFIGLGEAPPAPSWGVMLSTARNFLANSLWGALFPGLAITLLVVSVTVVGRRLQRGTGAAR
ncbi:ABC transporter permease [Puerhibacterium puerhi]|uniref:ABC transporter permease n=1 Tax=Puerhibacterium puerhi TaxID=2692623 RepID=UPI0013594ECF|nr:ABC transporter permease [Puerhibacterium puerhi]